MKTMRAAFLLLMVAVVAGWATEVRAQAEAETAAPAAEEAAEDPGFGVTVSLDTVGTYWWRGYDLSHGDPSALLYAYWTPNALPGLTLSTGFIYGLKLDDLAGDTRKEVDEWDLSGTYTFELPANFSLALGAWYYEYTSTYTQDYVNLDDSDAELSLGVSWGGVEWLTPTFTWYRGLDDNIEGNYLEFSAASSFALGDDEAWSLAPKLTAGWSSQYGVDNDFTNMTLSVPLSWSGDWISVTPSVNWVYLFEPETTRYTNDPNGVWGGLNISVWF